MTGTRFRLLTSAFCLAVASASASAQPIRPVRDFAPVVLIATGVQSLSVPAGSPLKSVKELVARARVGAE